MNLKKRAEDLMRDIPAVFLALKRKDTPLSAKVLAAVAVGYALSPVDLIPDFIPVVGALDDLLLLPVLVAMAVKRIPPAVFAECREQAAELWLDGKPKRWYFALPVVLVWLLLLALILKAILF